MLNIDNLSSNATILCEGRANVRLLEILSGCRRCHRHKALSLQDNSSWAGATSKGRSQSPSLNYLLRRKAGLSLLSEIACLLPWCETSKMPADELSRAIP